MSRPGDLLRYSRGFDRGMVYGRDLLKGVIVRRLRARLTRAVYLAREGRDEAPPSAYWQARADLLALLIDEMEEL